MTRLSMLVGTVALTSLVLFAPSTASADVILAYQGKAYTSVHNDPFMDGEYTKSMRVTGWIKLPGPLAPNCELTLVFSDSDCLFTETEDGSSLEFSFFDGIQSHQGCDGDDFLSFATDSAGGIVGGNVWTVCSLGPNAPVGGSEDELDLSSIHGDGVSEFCDNCDRGPWSHIPWHGAGATRVGR